MLEQGEHRLTSGFAAGWQQEGMIGYEMPGEGDEEWRGGEDFPFFPHQLEWMVRSSHGAGGGIQGDVAIISPTPMGLGMELGLKWQLPVGDELFAVAVNARGGGSFTGYGSPEEGFAAVLGHLDGGIIASVHPGDRHAVYASPRVRTDGLYHRVWSDDGSDDATGRAMSWGGALGVKLGREVDELFVETVLLHTPRVDQPDGVRVVVGVGVRGEGGMLPW